jgi:hypothetical protein
MGRLQREAASQMELHAAHVDTPSHMGSKYAHRDPHGTDRSRGRTSSRDYGSTRDRSREPSRSRSRSLPPHRTPPHDRRSDRRPPPRAPRERDQGLTPEDIARRRQSYRREEQVLAVDLSEEATPPALSQPAPRSGNE